MNPIRRLACFLLSLMLLVCLIQGELAWLEELLQKGEAGRTRGESLFDEYQQALETVWAELEYFPVPESSGNPQALVSFSNTWMEERSYGGRRSHEGTDLMAKLDQSGYYPVVSMTDGVIEKAGWLEKGGWRVGVRSAGGSYYYYAHLHSYAGDWEEGDSIKAGQLLGYMGDSGYGEEGTTGRFPVHLHVGIYLSLPEDRELAVNPYWMLRYLENKKLCYSY